MVDLFGGQCDQLQKGRGVRVSICIMNIIYFFLGHENTEYSNAARNVFSNSFSLA